MDTSRTSRHGHGFAVSFFHSSVGAFSALVLLDNRIILGEEKLSAILIIKLNREVHGDILSNIALDNESDKRMDHFLCNFLVRSSLLALEVIGNLFETLKSWKILGFLSLS